MFWCKILIAEEILNFASGWAAGRYRNMQRSRLEQARS